MKLRPCRKYGAELTPLTSHPDTHDAELHIQIRMTQTYAPAYSRMGGPDSSVGIVTAYRLDGPGIESR
jgi:hypothetical protein